MGSAQSTPGLSQVISLAQVVQGDVEGARQTQEQFSRTAPVVSQVRSLVEVSMGDHQAALGTQMEFASSMNDAVDATPGIGHMKAAIHKACGDAIGSERAMSQASSSIAGILVGGACAGGTGAVIGGVAASIATATTMPNNKRESLVAGLTRHLDMDADKGQTAMTLFTSDLSWCAQVAKKNGYGGFAVWNKVAYFRTASGPELLARLQPAPGAAFYIIDQPHTETVPNAGPPPRSASAPPSTGTRTSTRHQEENPLNIRFTHDEIADAFRPSSAGEGQRLDDAINDILSGVTNVEGIPPMVVTRFNGDLYSLSNRRLFVFRVLAMQGKLESVRIQLEPWESEVVQRRAYDERLGREASKWDRAYTTENRGQTVRVRGRGSRFQQMQYPREEAHSAGEGEGPRSGTGRRSGRTRTRQANAIRRRQGDRPEPRFDWVPSGAA